MNNTTHTQQARPEHRASSTRSVLSALRAMMPHRGLQLDEAIRLAERQATELLRLSQVNWAPVPLEILARLPRIRLTTKVDLPSSGMSFWDGDNWQLVARRDEPAQRQRFSLAHEFKHVIDHPVRDLLYGSGYLRERVADHFAACVLMPRMIITRAWCSGEQDIDRLADQFAVSPAAMERRLRDLGHLETPRPRRYVCTRGSRLPNLSDFAIAGQATSATRATRAMAHHGGTP